MTKQYEVSDFLNYVQGWLGANSVRSGEVTIEEMKAAMLNSLSMLEDSQDGIEFFLMRRADDYGNPEDWSME
jgi:hypothetical protein